MAYYPEMPGDRMDLSALKDWVFLGVIGFLAADHIRLRSEVYQKFVGLARVERMEGKMDTLLEKLEKLALVVARIEGARGAHAP